MTGATGIREPIVFGRQGDASINALADRVGSLEQRVQELEEWFGYPGPGQQETEAAGSRESAGGQKSPADMESPDWLVSARGVLGQIKALDDGSASYVALLEYVRTSVNRRISMWKWE